MQTSDLTSLFPVPGPFVSMHTDVSRNVSDPGGQLRSRWTTMGHELARHGVKDEPARPPGALTGRDVRLLPSGLVPRGDGVAATLRW